LHGVVERASIDATGRQHGPQPPPVLLERGRNVELTRGPAPCINLAGWLVHASGTSQR
jgi:hypothetical protein